MVPSNPTHKSLPPQTGIVYVVLLIYLTIMTCLGLAFINKVGIEAKIVMNRGKGSKAEYLAKSAASHAMWGLTNVPGFAPANNIYYMHDFAGGRYGYKVRKPTLTTYATVATIGVRGDSVVEQGYVPYMIPSNVYTIYGSNTNSLPFYRRLIAADWSNPGTVATGGSPTTYWAELEGCPIRNELIGGVIDSNSDIKIAVWDGSSWGNLKTLSINADMNYKCFDIAYESKSGQGLVVGRDGTATPLKFMVWNGTNWPANPQTAFSLPGGDVHDVVMASDPGSDEILIAVVTSWGDIQLVQWNGSAFNDLGTIETTAVRNDFRLVEIIYEHQSGHAMVVWSRNNDSALKYRMWNGTVLGPEGSLPDFKGNSNYVIRGAADSDPTSDYIVVAAIDNFYDINVAIWDGNAWIDSREIEISSSNYNVNSFDVAWEAAGEDAVIAWAYWGSGTFNRVYSLKWKKGTSLASSTVQVGPDCLAQLWGIRLLPISGTEKIVCLAENNSNNLYYCLWTGNSFKGSPAILLESNVTSKNDVAFALAEANVPRTGGTGGGGGANQPPVVEAGPNQTIYLPSNATLDGTVTDDGLPSPPAAVTAVWSKISGPGTVTFANSSQVDTTAAFSEAGTYVLRLTANDSNLSAYDEVTVVVSSICQGLVAGWTFDEGAGTTASDFSGNNNTLTLHTGATWNAGFYNSGLSLTSGNASAPDSSSLDLSSSYTLTAWVKPTSLSGYQTVLIKENASGGGGCGYWLQTVGSDISSGFNNGSGCNEHRVTAGLQVDTWYHFAVVFDDTSNTYKTYLNGTLLATQVETTAPIPNNLNLTVGQTSWGEYWRGPVDEVRIYNRPLSSAEVAELYDATNGGCSSPVISVLFVVNNPSSLTSQEAQRNTLMVTWGYTVCLIDSLDSQANYNTAVAHADIVYIPEEILSTDLGTKVRDVSIGVVNEEQALVDDYGFGSGYQNYSSTDIEITNSTHYITQPFSTGPLTIVSPLQSMVVIYGTVATGIITLAEYGGWSTLSVIETGGQLYGGGTAAGRRVQLPWGNNDFDLASLTSAGKTIMKRSIEWAAHYEGGWGGGGGSDTAAPTPDPMTWASAPAASGPTSITMTATTAADASGVEYYFECTSGGGHDSGWQDSAIYVDTGLTSSTSYTYRVKARDKSANQNETSWSTEASAATGSAVIYVYDITMGYRRSLITYYYGQATVWIKDTGGANVSGALVSGAWSGAVTGSGMGTTGSDGKIFFESPRKRYGGTFTFTVTDVSKSGYTYNPTLNVETSDSITAP